MPRVTWPLWHGRPQIEIEVPVISGMGSKAFRLLADTGGGSMQSPFEVVLNRNDCLAFGGLAIKPVHLSGTLSGPHSVFSIRIGIPQLSFDRYLDVVGAHRVRTGLAGIAAFPLLNRFH